MNCMLVVSCRFIWRVGLVSVQHLKYYIKINKESMVTGLFNICTQNLNAREY